MKEKQLYLFGSNKDTPNNDNQYKVILSLDKFILAGVLILIFLILSFSLGVEKGKKIVFRSNIEQEKKTEKEPIKENSAVIAEKQLESSEQGEQLKDKAEIKEDKLKYRVQVASFQKENSAREEAEKLREKGHQALIVKRGKYTVVYVGEFDTKKEAINKLNTLKERYKDCILRKL
ncbi:MAG: SPOR domain-containing protein [Candidatus Omnitrophota bacterium]